MRSWEWVGDAAFRQDNHGTMNCGPQPENMCVPKKRAPLTSDREIVDIALPWLNGALCNVCWSISPTRSQLPNAMPAEYQDKAASESFMMN